MKAGEAYFSQYRVMDDAKVASSDGHDHARS